MDATNERYERPVQPGGLAIASIVCGIVALAFNIIFILLPLGIVLGILSFVFGIVSVAQRRKGAAGIVLSSLSFLVVLIWAACFITVLAVDPTLRL